MSRSGVAGVVSGAAASSVRTTADLDDIGRTMHEAPDVPNDARPGHGLRLRPGLTIAIEPILVRGGSDGYAHADDGPVVLPLP